MSDLISISTARAKLPSIINKVSEGLKRYLITVNSKPKAVILSIEELESLEETAEILSLPGALRSIKQGLRDIEKGDYMSFDNLKKKHNLNG